MSESEEISLTCTLYVILISIIMIIVGSILGVYVFEPLLGIMGFGVLILICLICGFITGSCKLASKPKTERQTYSYTYNLKEQREREKLAELLNTDEKKEEREERKKLKTETIEKIKKMVKVSDRLRLSMMRKALNIDEDVFMDKIFDWAVEYGFRIDGDFLNINQDTVSDFIDALDKQFSSWEEIEKEKGGKI